MEKHTNNTMFLGPSRQKILTDDSLSKTPQPQASSTVEKRGIISLIDPHYYTVPEELRCRDNHDGITLGSESSLGILDINACKGLGDEPSQLSHTRSEQPRSLSFNPREMTGRSTYLRPNELQLNNRGESHQSNNTFVSSKNVINMEELVKTAQLQSQGVDDLLKTSNTPAVQDIRMSLQSFRHSLASSRNMDRANESWNYCPNEFSHQNNSEFGDSIFNQDNKINLSNDEISWMKEHGDLPINPKNLMSSLDKTSPEGSSNAGKNNSLQSEFSCANNSKMSMGNYFRGRSDNIQHMLNAASPEKNQPHPPLYTPDQTSAEHSTPRGPVRSETFNKSEPALPFNTISDDSGLTNYDNLEESQDKFAKQVVENFQRNMAKEPTVCKDLTNMMNIDDSISSNVFSMTNIRKIIGKLENETPSMLLDEILSLNKKQSLSKSGSERMLKVNKLQVNVEKRAHSVSPTLPDKSSFDQITNLFHSTRNGDELARKENIKSHNLDYSKKTPTKNEAENKHFSTRISANYRSSITSNSARSQSVLSPTTQGKNSSAFVSTLKNSKSHSGSSGFTESSIKSTNTIIHNKPTIALNSIKENIKIDYSDVACTDYTYKNKSPREKGAFLNTSPRPVSPTGRPLTKSPSEKRVQTQSLPSESPGAISSFAEQLQSILSTSPRVVSASVERSQKRLSPTSPRVLFVLNSKLSPSTSPRSVSPSARQRQYGLSPATSSRPLSPSDTSKELYGLVSPSSCNDPAYFTISHLESKRSPKNLMNRFKQDNSKSWVSPTQTKINDLSKECIPGQSPYRIEGLEKINSKFYSSPSQDGDFSFNVPTPGDWIRIESNEERMDVGSTYNMNVILTSLTSRWVAVKVNYDSIYVDGELCYENDKETIRIETLDDKILLKADSKHVAVFRVKVLRGNKRIQVNLVFHLRDAVTKADSYIKHVLHIVSVSSKLLVKTGKSGKLHFPIIPEESDACLPLVLWNTSPVDMQVSFNISQDVKNVFSLASVSSITKNDEYNVLSCRLQLMHKNTNMESKMHEGKPQNLFKNIENVYTIPANEYSGLKLMVYFYAPLLSSLEGDENIQRLNGKLNIMSVSRGCAPLPLETIPIVGNVGVSTLLIRKNQSTEHLMLDQGATEEVGLFNAGVIPMKYSIFITTYYDECEHAVTLVPCDTPIFTVSKQEVSLEPGEKATLKVSFPTGITCYGNVKRLLVFQSAFRTDVLGVIGNAGARSNSQQSGYSVNSATSVSSQMSLKTTRKVLSWGSLKLNESQVQDMILKNPSDQKLRIQAMTLGDGFKILSDSAAVSSLVLSLQPQECRAVRVVFRPLILGGHAGALHVTQRTAASNKTQNNDNSKELCKVPLQGVGGISNLIFRDGIFRHGNSQGLPLGSLNQLEDYKQIFFTIWNKGDSSGFVINDINLKWKYRSLQNDVTVLPTHGVVFPGESLRCVVNIPQKALLLARGKHGDIETVATLTVLHGDESSRLRIKKICSENSWDKLKQWNEQSQGKLKKICSKFPGENYKSFNLTQFKESVDSLKTLLDELQLKDVSVTYDVDLDSTVTRFSHELDETLLFQTMCPNSTSHNANSDSA